MIARTFRRIRAARIRRAAIARLPHARTARACRLGDMACALASVAAAASYGAESQRCEAAARTAVMAGTLRMCAASYARDARAAMRRADDVAAAL